jgi:hypothetical protein
MSKTGAKFPCVHCGLPWNAATSYQGMSRYCKECWKAEMTRRRGGPKIKQHLSEREFRKRAIRCTDKWRRNNPDRVRAISAVAYAIQNYDLTRGRCEGCGTDKFVCAYPADYAKPLKKVTWNCRRCHNKSSRAKPRESARGAVIAPGAV